MATTADFKNGLCFRHNGQLVTILEFLHVKPGKGGAFVRTKLKNLENGKIFDHTFTAGERIDIIRVENRPHQFLYKDEEGYHFMNNESFEQITLDEKLISAPQFLKEGENVTILFNADDEQPLSCDLPSYVTLEVTYTEPAVRGDTATNATKPATLETGATIQVPLFINIGDKIKVDTRTGEYGERAKE